MGGSAFSSLPNPPYTPRMPSEVYRRMVSACSAALRDLFVCVATPIEGPGKSDHGDIDMLVALERRVVFSRSADDSVPRSPLELMEAVKRALSAQFAIVHSTGSSANLAIPWPSDMDQLITPSTEASGAGEAVSNCPEQKDRYIQVDIRICPDVDQLCWTLYKHAHGDIWNLLGSTIRPFGLTVDEEALWLRIPEIEKFDRKKAKVCLSRDPVEILHFLGMKVEGYWAEPFESVDALFDYTTTCRLFYVRETSDEDAEADGNQAGIIGGEEGRKKLKSNDRRRMKGRPVYRHWINEFIPRLHAEKRFINKDSNASIEQVRAAVRDEAFAYFFVETEYRKRLREWQLKRDNEQMKSLIKDLVPSTMDPQRRACLISALWKIVMENDSSFGFAPMNIRDGEGFYDTEAVSCFIRDNMDDVAKVAWVKQQQRALEAMQLKASS